MSGLSRDAVKARMPPPPDELVGSIEDRVIEHARPSRLVESARVVRVSPPPDELVDALQDRVHVDAGEVRPARSVKFWPNEVRAGDDK